MPNIPKNPSSLISTTANDICEYLLVLLEHVPVLVAAVDHRGQLMFASHQHYDLVGVGESQANITVPEELYPDRFSRAIGRSISLAMQGESSQWEMDVNLKGGGAQSYLLHFVKLTVPSCDEPIVFILGSDITDKKHAERSLIDHQSQLAYLALHDPLTGLANRSLFSDRMEKCLARAKRNNANVALLLVGLDRFKHINDSLGQTVGDLFLKSAAVQLTKVLRDTDTIARLGGDEFVIILENIRDAEDISKVANKILMELSTPIRVQGQDITCTASIGISLYPKDGHTTDRLLRHADIAMFRAKTAGKNRFQFYLHSMGESVKNYLQLENDLRRSIERGDFILHYQPQINLLDGSIEGVEALVRWNHPERGMVSPLDFIPLAEETGLIEPIGEWVLNHACQRFSCWLDRGVNLKKIAVNLSARQFRQENFDVIVKEALVRSGLRADHLELEITESCVMENASNAIKILEDLSNMGLSLAIDDFGTGYSSLAYLRRFPVNKLKVDRSFINDIDSNENDAAIAKSIIDLGHNMSLRVIAEGVEREAQRAWLAEKGCDQVQGFFFSKPLDELSLLKMLEKNVNSFNRC